MNQEGSGYAFSSMPFWKIVAYFKRAKAFRKHIVEASFYFIDKTLWRDRFELLSNARKMMNTFYELGSRLFVAKMIYDRLIKLLLDISFVRSLLLSSESVCKTLGNF